MQAVVVIFFIVVALSILGGGDPGHGLLILWHIIETLIIVGLGIWAYAERASIERGCQAVARWYYFTFHPHPAEPLVRAAISSPNVINGRALAAALSELPPGNSIFRGVRLAQAEHLFHQMQAVSARKLRELETHARAEYERAALVSVQEAVALAAVALERAKALYRVCQRT